MDIIAEPMLALGDLKGVVVLDGIQHRPDIFPLLRVLADRSGSPARFLNLGSASPDLMRQKAGASWEGFALERVVSTLGVQWEQCWFCALHTGAELDLLVDLGRWLGFEFKLTDAPKATRSMRSALENLGLVRIYVIHAGTHVFPFGEHITATRLTGLRAGLE